LFSALGELHDPEIRAAVIETYGRFSAFIRDQVVAHRASRASRRGTRAAANGELPPEIVAWAIVGLGTAANIARELDLLSPTHRESLLGTVAKRLL